MSQFRLLFEGLCAFKDRASSTEAYLMSGHGHGANLMMPTGVLDLGQTSWLPSRIGTIYESGRPCQVGIWDLFGEEVSFVADGGAGSPPAWLNKPRLIQFSVEHAGSLTKDRKDIQLADPSVGVIELSGKSELEPTTDMRKVELMKEGAEPKTIQCSTMVEWRPSVDNYPMITNKAGRAIKLDGKSPAPWGCISNAAPVKPEEGLKHFHMYYVGVILKNGEMPLKIQANFTNIYDCVPPSEWP